MVSWYIKSRGFKSEQYLRKVVLRTLLSKTKVEETIEPFMEYFIPEEVDNKRDTLLCRECQSTTTKQSIQR